MVITLSFIKMGNFIFKVSIESFETNLPHLIRNSIKILYFLLILVEYIFNYSALFLMFEHFRSLYFNFRVNVH